MVTYGNKVETNKKIKITRDKKNELNMRRAGAKREGRETEEGEEPAMRATGMFTYAQDKAKIENKSSL